MLPSASEAPASEAAASEGSQALGKPKSTGKPNSAGKARLSDSRVASTAASVFADLSKQPARLLDSYSVWGLSILVLFLAAAYTPSLLPRTWFYQGLVGGITANIGYCVGIVLGKLVSVVSRFIDRRWGKKLPDFFDDDRKRWIDLGAIIMLTIAVCAIVAGSVSWQRDQALQMGMNAPGPMHYLYSATMSVIVCFGLIWAWRGLDLWTDRMAETLQDWGMKSYRATTAANLLAVVVVFLAAVVLLPQAGFTLMERQAVERNQTYREDIHPPETPMRAAGPGSEISWDGLGYEGSRFIADGFTQQQLEQVTGRPAQDPIRLYAGVGNGDTMADRIHALIRELNRTDAASRKALMVMPVTGTGWANPVAAQAFELLYDGDTAIASAQFGVLPSGAVFLTGSDSPSVAGRDLVTAVATWWSRLPEDNRPELYIYGESLGTVGVEAALEMLNVLNIVPDGVLMVGPPRSNKIHRELTEERDPGSPEYQPVVEQHPEVKFAATGRQALALGMDQQWQHRVLYLQHATDPVTWWEPNLMFGRPDWLVEPAGPARSSAMAWYPFITFWQVSADLGGAGDVPDGYGHNYASELLDAWITVTDYALLNTAHLDLLRHQLDEILSHQGPEKGHISHVEN